MRPVRVARLAASRSNSSADKTHRSPEPRGSPDQHHCLSVAPTTMRVEARSNRRMPSFGRTSAVEVGTGLLIGPALPGATDRPSHRQAAARSSPRSRSDPHPDSTTSSSPQRATCSRSRCSHPAETFIEPAEPRAGPHCGNRAPSTHSMAALILDARFRPVASFPRKERTRSVASPPSRSPHRQSGQNPKVVDRQRSDQLIHRSQQPRSRSTPSAARRLGRSLVDRPRRGRGPHRNAGP